MSPFKRLFPVALSLALLGSWPPGHAADALYEDSPAVEREPESKQADVPASAPCPARPEAADKEAKCRPLPRFRIKLPAEME
jgi:hypothetical protein